MPIFRCDCSTDLPLLLFTTYVYTKLLQPMTFDAFLTFSVTVREKRSPFKTFNFEYSMVLNQFKQFKVPGIILVSDLKIFFFYGKYFSVSIKCEQKKIYYFREVWSQRQHLNVNCANHHYVFHTKLLPFNAMACNCLRFIGFHFVRNFPLFFTLIETPIMT